jgi:hypothetical protein
MTYFDQSSKADVCVQRERMPMVLNSPHLTINRDG